MTNVEDFSLVTAMHGGLLSKYTILYGTIITLVVTIQSVARRWTASNSCMPQRGMHGDAWSPCIPLWGMQLFCHPKYSILYGALMIFVVGGGGE